MYKITINKYTSKKKNAKKSDDTWYYRFQARTLNEFGERRYIRQSGFATKAEAEQAAEIAYRAEHGFGSSKIRRDDRISNIVLKNYVENYWLPNSAKMWQPGTVNNYKKLLNGYILPHFGLLPLCEITLDPLQTFFDDLYLDTEMSINTINNLRALMSQILKYAQNNRHIDFNPMDALKKKNFRVLTNVNKRKNLREVISDEVIGKILDRFPYGTTAHIPFMLCLYAGLREGEALGLCWSDICFEKNCIFVNRQLQRTVNSSTTGKGSFTGADKASQSTWCVSNPKYNSKRVVYLTSELKSLLMREKERQDFNRRILGTHYKNYFCKRNNEPKVWTDIEKFTLYAKDEFENGEINEDGEGFELDFVNRAEDGKMTTDCALKHLCRVIHGKEKEIAISETFNIHSLRHTYASKLRARGIPEHIVVSFLGHSSKSETNTYLHVSESEIVKAFEGR